MAFTILIVDDSAVVRAAISKSLALSEASISEIHKAADGREALNILKETWIDLGVVDHVVTLSKISEKILDLV